MYTHTVLITTIVNVDKTPRVIKEDIHYMTYEELKTAVLHAVTKASSATRTDHTAIFKTEQLMVIITTTDVIMPKLYYKD